MRTAAQGRLALGRLAPQRGPVRQGHGDTKLPAYNYFNFGAGFAIPSAGVRVNLDLLNAFQSKGLEEGNPRLVSAGGAPIFLARPLLPRRLQASVTYDFGGLGPVGVTAVSAG